MPERKEETSAPAPSRRSRPLGGDAGSRPLKLEVGVHSDVGREHLLNDDYAAYDLPADRDELAHRGSAPWTGHWA